jgi:hypothetical protein
MKDTQPWDICFRQILKNSGISNKAFFLELSKKVARSMPFGKLTR